MRVKEGWCTGVGEVEGAIKSKTLINSVDPVGRFEASHAAAEGSAMRLELALSALALALI